MDQMKYFFQDVVQQSGWSMQASPLLLVRVSSHHRR
jgi:hypothetical protein